MSRRKEPGQTSFLPCTLAAVVVKQRSNMVCQEVIYHRRLSWRFSFLMINAWSSGEDMQDLSTPASLLPNPALPRYGMYPPAGVPPGRDIPASSRRFSSAHQACNRSFNSCTASRFGNSCVWADMHTWAIREHTTTTSAVTRAHVFSCRPMEHVVLSSLCTDRGKRVPCDQSSPQVTDHQHDEP